jgi:UDP-N-acetylmuramoylalanine--D-glutamate ligase
MIFLPHCKGHSFAILGLGKSGLSAAESLAASGAHVTLWDDDERARQRAAAKGFHIQDIAKVPAEKFLALIMSPGIPHIHPTPHPIATHMKAAGIPIWSDIELLFQACPDATYIGITGTNGKSTTTALIGHILSAAGKKVGVGGNLGTPALT